MLVLLVIFYSFSCFAQINSIIEIKTEAGSIIVELYNDKAPVTAANFLRYVAGDKFINASFYRTVTMDNQPQNKIKIEVIQGGIGDSTEIFPPIIHETTKATGILHKDGVISMARNEPGSETSEFFICIGDQPELDYGGKRNPDGQGFAAFGKVIDGMDIVREIHKMPSVDQRLKPQVKIINIILMNK